MNALCLIAPDKTVYKLRNNKRYYWSEKPLDLSHFRIVENSENDTTAMVRPVVVGAISRVYNYPPAVLFTSDYLGLAWIDTTSFDSSKEGREALQVLLEHEKLHLDINEIYKRKAQDSISSMLFYSYDEKYRVVDYFFEISDSIQDIFDRETDHGTIEENNKEWYDLIKKKLKSK